MQPLKTTIRKFGNSQGVIIPKPVLAQVGLTTEAEMVVEGNALVIRRPSRRPREGWAKASRRLSQEGDDALVWPEFGNAGDQELEW
jgi:antitoxin MazE